MGDQEFLPDNIEGAVRVLADWIAQQPGDSGTGGVRILRNESAVFIYWKGAVPTGLRRLAERQSVPGVVRGIGDPRPLA